jgi:hypothetical protein
VRRSLVRRGSTRGLTAVEVAILFAIVGSLLAVAVPAFLRDLRASRFVEPVEGLQRIGTSALAYAEAHAAVVPKAPFPASAPLTPATVPRATRDVDAPNTWDHPTWRALDFRASPEGIPHAFSFAFDAPAPPGSRPGGDGPGARPPETASFAAHAHGDLDGDGVRSTFEIRGHVVDGQGGALDPGMIVESEVE